MKKDITISYESFRISGQNKESFSDLSNGTLTRKDGEIYISYSDSCGKTVLKINDSEISVIRFGENSNTLKFKTNGSYRFLYKTPYGVFEAALTTHTASYCENADGGCVKLAYSLDFSGEKSEHNFKLTYKYI